MALKLGLRAVVIDADMGFEISGGLTGAENDEKAEARSSDLARLQSRQDWAGRREILAKRLKLGAKCTGSPPR
jgi:hypothetical protein